MARQTKIKVDLSGLDELLEKFGKNHYVKIGILGSNAAAKHPVAVTHTLKSGKKVRHTNNAVDSPLTYAEIGVIQEFGSISRKIPPRSFLRMPIEMRKSDFIRFLGTPKANGFFNEGNIKGIYKSLGIVAEGIIDQAFGSRGFGQWKKNSPITIDIKGSDSPLIDTGSLRKSITSAVVQK